MLKTAHDAEEFMRTGARVSPSWPGGDLRGRIRCSRLISRRSRQNPLQTGRAIRFQRNSSTPVVRFSVNRRRRGARIQIGSERTFSWKARENRHGPKRKPKRTRRRAAQRPFCLGAR
jgi:hypothetical protein